MDEEDKRGIATMRAEIMAVRLVVNEALAIALSHERDPDKAVSLARLDINDILDGTEKMAKTGPTAEFRAWFLGAVRNSVKDQLDAIEARVSTLTQRRTQH